jgi:hypothetical protein
MLRSIEGEFSTERYEVVGEAYIRLESSGEEIVDRLQWEQKQHGADKVEDRQ